MGLSSRILTAARWLAISAGRIVPILLFGALALTGLVHGLTGKKNQTFDGVLVQDVTTYEFYPVRKTAIIGGHHT
jgi:hypothetical protein